MMNYLTKEQQTLLLLIRRSLWGENVEIPTGVDWEKVDTMAREQGITSLIYDGAMKVNPDLPAEILRMWKKKTLGGVLKNEQLLAAQDKIFRWFADEGISAQVLKGSSVGCFYPQPDLRVLGDIDVLVKKMDLKRAEQILQEHGFSIHEEDHDFHVAYSRGAVYVELHYEVTRFPDTLVGNVAREECAAFLETVRWGTIGDHTFPMLSEGNQILSLILHMSRHMYGRGIGLRQLCDWAVFAEQMDQAYFAEVMIPTLKRCGLLQYTKVVTSTCARYLGLTACNMSWCEDVDDQACLAVMMDIFNSGNMGVVGEGMKMKLFTDHSTVGNDRLLIRSLIGELNWMAYHYFPLVKKYKILLPFVWIFLILRYWLRSLVGQRKRKSLRKAVQSAKEQCYLYDMLQLFVADN